MRNLIVWRSLSTSIYIESLLSFRSFSLSCFCGNLQSNSHQDQSKYVLFEPSSKWLMLSPQQLCIQPMSPSHHLEGFFFFFCNLGNCSPFHQMHVFLNPFRHLNHDGSIARRTHSSIEETSHCLDPLSFSHRIGVPNDPFFPCLMRQTVGFLVPFSVTHVGTCPCDQL